jgi:hypothetical protein
MRRVVSIAVVLGLAAAVACSERTTSGEDEEARAACEAQCNHLEACGIDDDVDGDVEDCVESCRTDQPWIWSECRAESFALFECNAELTCDELRITADPGLLPDPIEQRPCYEPWWAWGSCFANRDT